MLGNNLTVVPYKSSLGARFVALLIELLKTLSTWVKCRAQSDCLRLTYCLIDWMMVLFARSVAPSVSGWYDVESLILMSSSRCNSFQKWLRNNLSRSDTIVLGSPN